MMKNSKPKNKIPNQCGILASTLLIILKNKNTIFYISTRIIRGGYEKIFQL